MATDPTKVATGEQDPSAPDEGAEQDKAPVPAEPQAEEPEEREAEPTYVGDLRTQLADAKEAAKKAHEQARRAQGTSDANTARLERRISRLDGLLKKALTANMDEASRAAFERDLARDEELETLRAGAEESAPDLREWQSFASRALQRAGLKYDDPRLVEAFNAANGGSTDPKDWPVALVAAITKVKDAEVGSAKESAQKERDAEKVRERNARRAQEGRVDRGAPAGQARVSVAAMSDKEFDEHWENLKKGAAAAASR